MDKISVIVPIYNAEKYLEDCINSILEQTYKNIEIILVNDGSKDKSLYICEKYQAEYSNIKVINKKNEGVTKARKDGLDIAEGKWVAFVDSDDTIDSTMYEDLMKSLKENNADMAVLKRFTIFPTNLEKEECVSSLEALKSLCELKFPTSMCCNLYPTEVAKTTMVDGNIHFLEDFLYNYTILHQIKTVALCDGEYYHYTVNPDSINHQSINDKRMSCLKIAPLISLGGRLFNEELEEYTAFVIAHCLITNLVVLKYNAREESKYYEALKNYSRVYGDRIKKTANVPKLYKILIDICAYSPKLVSYIMILKKVRRKK